MLRRWRLVDDLDAALTAAQQMERDLELLDEVAAGAPPALRVYSWATPALSLGRFQPAADVDRDACARLGVDVVRRPTGGRGLLHGGDLTYSVVLPRPTGSDGTVDAVYRRLARGLLAGLESLGVEAQIACHEGDAGPACFASLRGSDLRVGGRKLVGSAQVHRGPVVLQHGSLLLRRLHLDETDVLTFDDEAMRVAARARLCRATVTLEELRAPSNPRVVAEALVAGFESGLDLHFRSRSSARPPPPATAESGALHR